MTTFPERPDRRVDPTAVIDRSAQLDVEHLVIGPGVRIGPEVRISARSAVLHQDVEIGAETTLVAEEIDLGPNCLVFPRSRILVRGSCQLGEWAKIGHHCVIKAGKVEVGDEFWMNHHAEIGGGGWGAGEGSFTVGEHSHVGRYTHVNTARAVVLGRRTAIGMDCTVATHAHWQPGVDGYTRQHGTVTLGDDVAVYSRSVISPGVHLGDRCVVAGGSVVVSSFGAGTVAGGSRHG